MSATAADLNNDGWMDLYVANDSMENYYFENRGDGTFVEKALTLGLAFGQNGQGVSSMGPTIADVDGDGSLDILIPDMDYGSLLSKDGNFYVDRIGPSGLAVICGQYTGWGAVLADFDNDGLRDVFIANGNAHHEYPEDAVLARNAGDGTFVDVASSSGAYFRTKWVGRGATWADFDSDGNVDLLVVDTSGPPHLLRNGGGAGNHWLEVDAVSKGGTRTAIGARVTVSAGARRQTQDVIGVNGYLSQGDTRVHVGLGRGHEGRPGPGAVARRDARRVEGREGRPGVSRGAGKTMTTRRLRRGIVGAALLAATALAPAAAIAQAAKQPVYVGARACAQCHEGHAAGNQYSKWLLSAHAKAWATLATPEAKVMARLSGLPDDPEQAPLCLGCHATAAETEAWERDPTFRLEDGVQCEKCHGPGSEYMAEDVMRDPEKARRAGLRRFTKRDTIDGRYIPPEGQCLICHLAALLHRPPEARRGRCRPPMTWEGSSARPSSTTSTSRPPTSTTAAARTLEEIWTVHNPDDTHGQTNDMTKEQLNDLIEYLKTL